MPPCMSGEMMRRLSLKEQKRRKVLIVFPGIWALLTLIFKDVSFLRFCSQRAGRMLGRRGGRRKLASSLHLPSHSSPKPHPERGEAVTEELVACPLWLQRDSDPGVYVS